MDLSYKKYYKVSILLSNQISSANWPKRSLKTSEITLLRVKERTLKQILIELLSQITSGLCDCAYFQQHTQQQIPMESLIDFNSRI